MKQIYRINIIVFILLFAVITSASAGGRYYGSSHRHYSHGHYGHKSYGHHHSSGDAWLYLGAGLLTGVLFSAIIHSHPRKKTVVYRSPPPVIVYPPQPVYERVHAPNNFQELVLRQVETTPQLLNVRSTPYANGNITGQLQKGTLLDVLGAAPEWLYIKTHTGKYGWIMSRYTRPANRPVG